LLPETRTNWFAVPGTAVAPKVTGDPLRSMLEAVAACGPVEEPRTQNVSARPSAPVVEEDGSTLPCCASHTTETPATGLPN
jgi:hypothetical protein